MAYLARPAPLRAADNSMIKACIFDAYGTLFDVAAAARALGEEIGPAWPQLAETWRAKQLNYTWLRSLMGDHADFWQVTGEALDYSLAAIGISNPDLRRRLMDLYLNLAAYPEVPALLRRLKAAGLTTGILSNGSPAMLEGACKSAGISDLLDVVISVEDVGIYKPDPRIYQLVTDQLKLRPEEVAFHSSNGWDAHGAKRAGFFVLWINRLGQPPEGLPHKPDAELHSLSEVPVILGLA